MFGLPNVLAKYPRGVIEPQEARAMYEQLLQDYGQGKPIIIPDDLDVSLTAGPTGTGNSAQVQMVGWANTEISKAVQGETLTTELSQTGSYNIGDIHADTKHAIIRDDARGLASDIRSDLFRSIVELNIEELMTLTGESREDVLAAVPLCSWRIERETNPVQRSQILINFANAGLPIGVDQVYEEFGIDAPADGAELLRGEPVLVGAGGASVGSVDAAAGVENTEAKEPTPKKG
jgi:phage gp29-like protein